MPRPEPVIQATFPAMLLAVSDIFASSVTDNDLATVRADDLTGDEVRFG